MSEKGRKVLKYNFFKVSREWRSLVEGERRRGAEEFLRAVKGASEGMQLRFYSLVGIRGDADFMIWTVSDDMDAVQRLYAAVNSTLLGRYLETPYAYSAMSRKSQYLGGHVHAGQEGTPVQGTARYIFVYPFVKKREWYRLPFKERQRMMAEHFKIGHGYPSIKINTGYSFGIDDQEFVLAFESDNLSDFVDLVEELRGSDASAYTEQDVPSFTCRSVEPEALLRSLG